jgi:uncharacterized membrane protein YccC
MRVETGRAAAGVRVGSGARTALVMAIALAVLWLLAFEHGQLLGSTGVFLHELTHDGRHLLGLPCD